MASDIFADIDTSELMEAMQFYEEVTKKDAVEIINRAARNACFGAAGKTKLANLGSIKKWDPEKEGKSKTTKKRAQRFYAMAADNGFRKGGGIKREATRLFNKRLSARAYSKAVWYGIAKDFGASLKGKFQLRGPKGRKATLMRLAAVLDTGPLEDKHISEVMKDALQEGVGIAAADLRNHAQKKLEARAKQFSGR